MGRKTGYKEAQCCLGVRQHLPTMMGDFDVAPITKWLLHVATKSKYSDADIVELHALPNLMRSNRGFLRRTTLTSILARDGANAGAWVRQGGHQSGRSAWRCCRRLWKWGSGRAFGARRERFVLNYYRDVQRRGVQVRHRL